VKRRKAEVTLEQLQRAGYRSGPSVLLVRPKVAAARLVCCHVAFLRVISVLLVMPWLLLVLLLPCKISAAWGGGSSHLSCTPRLAVHRHQVLHGGWCYVNKTELLRGWLLAEWMWRLACWLQCWVDQPECSDGAAIHCEHVTRSCWAPAAWQRWPGPLVLSQQHGTEAGGWYRQRRQLWAVVGERCGALMRGDAMLLRRLTKGSRTGSGRPGGRPRRRSRRRRAWRSGGGRRRPSPVGGCWGGRWAAALLPGMLGNVLMRVRSSTEG
jgi:hypothetical protein